MNLCSMEPTDWGDRRQLVGRVSEAIRLQAGDVLRLVKSSDDTYVLRVETCLGPRRINSDPATLDAFLTSEGF